MKNTNIVGEPFAKYVNDQIKQRQLIYGGGLNSTRDPKHIQYLNSRLSWVKMASSVIVNPDPSKSTPEESFIKTAEDGTFRLKKLGLDIEQFKGYKLASNFILFNGVQQLTLENVGNQENTTYVDPTVGGKFLEYTKRAGISNSNSNWNNSAYGLGGTDFGLQPMPGINSLDIRHVNRGSIRRATITLKAYNKFQFEVINTLYLRLGFNMILEWGNSHYIESSGLDSEEVKSTVGNIDYVRNTLIEDIWFSDKYANSNDLELLKTIEKYRTKYDGNYDGFIGKVTNFSWDYNPDGSYSISIDLASLGDVIESLKVNVSHNYKVDQNTKNTDDITTFLNNIQKSPESFNTSPNNSNYLDINQLRKSQNTGNFFIEGATGYFPEVPNDLKSYIKFGTLLEFLQNNILIHFSNGGNNPFPIVYIDFDPEVNVMPIYPNQISFDPKVCLVRTDYFSPPSSNNFYFYEPMAPFSSGGNVPYGKIMNIYLNFKTVKDKLKSNIDNKGNLSLFNFIKSLCDEINKSLGGINNLEPIVIEDRNTLVIFDQNNYPNRDNIRKEILEKLDLPKEEETSFPIELFGYNKDKNSSNFVKNFSLKTEIDPSLSTILTIGATSEGQVVGEDATAFSKWNTGLTDRYKQFVAPSTPIPPPTSSVSQDKESAFNTIGGLYGSGYSPSKHNKIALKRRNDLMKENIQTYLLFSFGKSYNKDAYTNNKETLYSNFNRDNYSDWVNIGIQSIKNYISNLNNEKGVITNTLGFIPLKLQLTLDGLSGIKIYQKLKVNTEFLPSNYPEILEFLVTKVDHSLSDNQWVTKISTLSIPIIKEIPIETELSSLSLAEEPFFSPLASLTFNLPVQPAFGSPTIRSDKGGKGNYGASREAIAGTSTPRKHTGIDLTTYIGQEIYAPITGNIQRTKAKTTSKLDGIKIFGTGEFSGITIYLFYAQLTLSPGSIVSQGEKIGDALDLSKDYSEDVTDHIHFKIEFNGSPVNPERIYYNYNSKTVIGSNLFYGYESFNPF